MKKLQEKAVQIKYGIVKPTPEYLNQLIAESDYHTEKIEKLQRKLRWWNLNQEGLQCLIADISLTLNAAE